jgi:hypothetical protein
MNMPHEKVTHKEHDHIVQGPDGVITKDVDIEEMIDKTGGPAGTSHPHSTVPPSGGTMSDVGHSAETGPATTAPTRVNPRTGRPLSIPKPLSLTPHEMSPIVVPDDIGGGQMISETHEEVRYHVQVDGLS